MSEAEGMQAFIDHMLMYTIRLVRAEPNKFPIGISSGFMIPVEDRIRVISAGHAISAKPNWAVETVRVSDWETLMLNVADVKALAKIGPKGPTHSRDLAWGGPVPEEA